MQTLKDFLEILYYLSGPVLVIVAIYGLKQIKISSQQIKETRETRKISSKREAYNIAAEQCKYYIETIIPLLNKLDEIIDVKKLEYFEKSEIIIDNEKIAVKPYMTNGALDKVFNECLEEMHTVINCIESFSVYFVSGVAADIVGFNTLGRTYTNSVRKLLPIIIPFGKDGSFKHTKGLFTAWNARIDKEALLKEKEEVEKKIKNQRTISINTIGTK
jgi:hypothetical protein